VMELRAPDGKLTVLKGERGQRVLRPETAITMRSLMERVMLTGTGKGGRLRGWTSGGKTGTAQIFDRKIKRYIKSYNSSFLGFAPLQNPAIVVVVTLNETRLFGGTIAAPVFKEVAAESLRILNIPMDNPSTVVAENKAPAPEEMAEGDLGLSDEASAGADAAMLPDTRKEVMTILAAAIKEDPEMEEWMLGNPRDNLPRALPGPTSLPPMTVSLGTPHEVGDTESLWRYANTPETAARLELEYKEEAKLRTESDRGGTSAMTSEVYINSKVAPNFLGKSMREVVAEAMSAGLELQPYGRGLARKQIPPPGTRVPHGVAIRVMFTP